MVESICQTYATKLYILNSIIYFSFLIIKKYIIIRKQRRVLQLLPWNNTHAHLVGCTSHFLHFYFFFIFFVFPYLLIPEFSTSLSNLVCLLRSVPILFSFIVHIDLLFHLFISMTPYSLCCCFGHLIHIRK